MDRPRVIPLAPRTEAVFRLAEQLGFALAGIAPAEGSDHAAHVKRWLAEGRHGEMDYLASHLEQRLNPAALLPGAKAVICVADLYPASTHHKADADRNPTGRISRYAWGDDYHKVIKKRLFELADVLRTRWPQYTYKVAVDTAPLLEHEHAMRAGLGWTGKHTLTIHPHLGSWMALGEIVTTMPLQTSAEAGYPARTVPGVDHCGTCTRCIDACPTQCIAERGYSIDASRCISYLTIEHRGAIDPSLHEALGDWVAGCDVCQEVCPFNREPGVSSQGAGKSHDADQSDIRHQTADITLRPEYAPRPPGPAIALLDVLDWDADARQRMLTRSALKRIKLEQWKRNALIAAGNHLRRKDDPALRHRIEQLANDPDEHDLVRMTAQQVLARLASHAEDRA